MNAILSPTQTRIVNHGEGALLVVAGPGSGKTRVLTERVRRLLVEADGYFRILALTFTNKAANEMKGRLAEFPDIEQKAYIGTMHSFCMEVLSNRGKPVGIDGPLNIFESYSDRKQVLLQAIMDDPELRPILFRLKDSREQEKALDRWLEMISNAKNLLRFPEMMDDDTDRRIYEAYDAGLRISGAVDFDDLLFLTYRLFQERPKIADFYRRQYRFICIDEAQDMNESQYQFLRSLCGLEYRNIMMVGDPKQAIFVFNGANPKYLDLFERDFEAKKISLNENFRSSSEIVKAAKALNPEYKVEGQLPIKGAVGLIVGKDEKDEAVQVMNAIQRLLDNGHKDIEGPATLDRCALIGRTRYALACAEEELGIRGWPYYKQLSSQHVSESDLVQEFELCLRLLANQRDQLHLALLLKRWNMSADLDYLTSVNFESGLQLVAALREKATATNSTIRAVLDAIGRMEFGNEDFQFHFGLDALDNYASSLENQEERSLIMQDTLVWRRHWDSFLRSVPGGQHQISSFLSQVALGATQQHRQTGLALLTIHSAKGLEFDVVFVMGMAERTFPDYRAKGHALDEEKRSAFVAVTRSRRLLVFSYPKTKLMPWGDTRQQEPSRYLKIVGLVR